MTKFDDGMGLADIELGDPDDAMTTSIEGDKFSEKVPEPIPSAPVAQDPVETAAPVVADTPADTPAQPTVDDEYAKLLRENGLDRKYKDVPSVIRSHAEQQRYVTRLEQERAEFLRAMTPAQTRQPQVQAPDLSNIGNEMFEQPALALKKLGVVSQSDLDELRTDMGNVRQLRVAVEEMAFANTHRDYPEFQDDVYEYFKSNPELLKIPTAMALPLVYNEVKRERTSRMGPAPVTTVAVPVDPQKKAMAQTTATSSKARKREFTEDDFKRMTPEQLEKVFGFQGTE